MVKDSMNEGLPAHHHNQPQKMTIFYAGSAAVVILAGAGGFLGGIQFQKSAGTTTAGGSAMTGPTSSGAGRGGQGGFGARRSGGFGTVTAISSDSITIDATAGPQSDSSASTSKTYKITSDTTITNGTSAGSVSDIQNGDRVIVRTSTSDTSTATAITVNPSFGGGAGAPGGQTQSDSMPSDTPSDSNPT